VGASPRSSQQGCRSRRWETSAVNCPFGRLAYRPGRNAPQAVDEVGALLEIHKSRFDERDVKTESRLNH
jgi:hypothetical protein